MFPRSRVLIIPIEKRGATLVPIRKIPYKHCLVIITSETCSSPLSSPLRLTYSVSVTDNQQNVHRRHLVDAQKSSINHKSLTKRLRKIEAKRENNRSRLEEQIK